MEKKKGPAMTAPAPKSREEWEAKLSELARLFKDVGFNDAGYGYNPSKRETEAEAEECKALVFDSIMALQSEAERVTEEAKWCRCIVARGYENEKCRNCGLFAKNPFEKARQPK